MTGILHIATAGWSIPRPVAEHFPASGSGLARYAARFDGVEINTTFYRSHRASTYARWFATTPGGFRFAVKLPRTITHEAKLVDADDLIAGFQSEAAQLGDKLGPLLVQLPPSLVFAAAVAQRFFTGLRDVWPETIVCEPRHPSWFEPDADALLRRHEVARVAADPARHPAAADPGGWTGVAYRRLHGSPRIYASSYSDAELEQLAAALHSHGAAETWCVFDNTSSGAAAANALRLQSIVGATAP